jgi:hypothetical protein
MDCFSYVISLLANLDARTQSSSLLQEVDIPTLQITLGSTPQKHTGNGTPSDLAVASL